jgi:hypothetical protein
VPNGLDDLAARGSPNEQAIDAMTDAVIKSDFDDRILGHFFNRCIDQFGSIEGAIAFAAVIAKAISASKTSSVAYLELPSCNG